MAKLIETYKPMYKSLESHLWPPSLEKSWGKKWSNDIAGSMRRKKWSNDIAESMHRKGINWQFHPAGAPLRAAPSMDIR